VAREANVPDGTLCGTRSQPGPAAGHRVGGATAPTWLCWST